MLDLLFQIALSNVCISFIFAIAAVIAGSTLKRPAITHLLWLLVLVKLLTPPVVGIPALPGPWMGDTDTAANFNEHSEGEEVPAGATAVNATFSSQTALAALDQGKQWLFLAWLLGSMAVFFWSLLQAYRFHRRLRTDSEIGAPELQSAAAGIAACLGLNPVPAIYVTSANITPLVWWIGGRVWVVIPEILIREMETRQLQWILSHELAHVRRRDYAVRWIEWLACVCFWWNPMTWWARYNLRANEEICCDAMVVSGLRPKPYLYGDSLLKAVEILAYPAHRPPVMASGINSGELLRRRVKMIVSKNLNRSNLRWLQAGILLAALIVLPLGLTKAQDQSTAKPGGTETETIRAQRFEVAQAKAEAALARKQAALEAGRISEQEAKAEAELAQRQAALEQQLEYRHRAKIDKASAEIQEALAAGLISAEEAKAKEQTLELNTARIRVNAYPTEEYEAVLKAAVADGRITREYVDSVLADYDNAQYERIVQELKAAVEAGKITEEGAAARTADFIEMLNIRKQRRELRWQQ